jgi:hypothetical protein
MSDQSGGQGGAGFWAGVRGKVEAAESVEESTVNFVRELVDKLEAAFNANDWNAARRIAQEADAHAEDIGAAIKANTDKA